MKLPVLELGAGEGSTKYLRQYCADEGLEFCTYDFNEKYAKENESVFVRDWNLIPWRKDYSVVLVDESPGEHRKESIIRLQNNAQIIVVHDSEPVGWNASDYQVRPLFEKFKYMKDLKSEAPEGAWTTALSNFIDITGI